MPADAEKEQHTKDDDFGAIDVTALMEQVRFEWPQGTVTVQGTVHALRPSRKDPTVSYGDMRGFDRSIMSFQCSAAAGLSKEEHVVLRGTLTVRKSRMHSGFDLELVAGTRVGNWTPSEPVSVDQTALGTC